MYKAMKFELRSVEEIKQDIVAMKRATDELKRWCAERGYSDKVDEIAAYHGILWLHQGEVRTAFIGDSNSLVMKTEELAEVIEFLYQVFPTLERVTSYARAKTLLRKKQEELIRLKQAGLSRVHVGLETGDEELLRYIEKGVTPAEMIAAGKKVKEAGICLSEYVILGLGGKERGEQHARATAQVLNEIDPDFIRVRTLVLHPGTPLYEKWQRGEFHLCSPEEVIRETRWLIENLEVTSQFLSDHVSNYIRLDGKFPEDKEFLLNQIERVLAAPAEVREQIFPPEYLRRI
jgi:radical SAM superfamily enzyme YgiQ (UPF0313 family)